MTFTKPAAMLAVATVAGASTVLAGAPAPANASVTDGCGVGTLIAPGVCEIDYTVGTSTFTATADMTHLEALLVGAGGSAYGNSGYAAAGGGGDVKVVDLTGATGDLTVKVPVPGIPGGISGAAVATVDNGLAGSSSEGGASGNGNLGDPLGTSTYEFGGGGGAGGAASGADGGPGVVVSTLVAPGSLFADDSRCFGGGGAAGAFDPPFGVPGCGAGAPDAGGTAVIPATANSGGGAGVLITDESIPLGTAAGGYIALRWNAVYTIAFDTDGIGTAPTPQTVSAGGTVTEPSSPTAVGYVFQGWFLDPAHTVAVDFSAKPSASATFYGAWRAEYTIAFDTMGHGTAPAAQTVLDGDLATEPADPTATGYAFQGWFTSSALTTPVDFSAGPTASATYYAGWRAEYTIAFDTLGHGTAPASLTVLDGDTVTPPTAPTAAGYVFGGWYQDAALTTPVDFAVAPTASATYYARWTVVPAVADALTDSGADVSPLVVGGAAAGVGLGAMFLALGARRRRAAD